jgi:SulP family sulfate permease
VPREVGRDHIFRRKMEMLPKLVANLDPDICVTCTTRIFRECPKAPVINDEAEDKA